MFGSLSFAATPSGVLRYSWKPPEAFGEWKNAPLMPAFDFAITIAFSGVDTLKTTPATYAFPLESHVTLGSAHASPVCPSSSSNCQNGGVWSPQWRPPSNDQS